MRAVPICSSGRVKCLCILYIHTMSCFSHSDHTTDHSAVTMASTTNINTVVVVLVVIIIINIQWLNDSVIHYSFIWSIRSIYHIYTRLCHMPHSPSCTSATVHRQLLSNCQTWQLTAYQTDTYITCIQPEQKKWKLPIRSVRRRIL